MPRRGCSLCSTNLHLTELVTSITGLSAIGAAAILAETGDPRRFATARALVKHAGLAPREKLSGTFVGRTKLTGQGRPGLRLAAWRAVWGAQRANPVYAARFTHLTTRETNKLKVHPSPRRDRRRDPATPARRRSPPAKPGTPTSPPTAPATTRCPSPPNQPQTATQADGRGEPHAALRHHVISTHIMGSPARRLTTRLHAAGTNPITAMQGQTTDEAPTKPLTQNDLR